MSNPWRDVPAQILHKGFLPMHRRENRICQRVPSIICTPRGRLWATWVAGGDREPHIDSYGVLACSDDGGRTWQDPMFIIDHPDTRRVRIAELVPWLDEQGRLWINWTQAPGECYLKENVYMTTWSACVEYPDAPVPRFGKPVFRFSGGSNSKPVRLKNGDWLFLAENVLYPHESCVYSSANPEKVPVLRGTAHSTTPYKYAQTAQLLERQDGSLWQLSRIERGYFGGMEESVSYDGGRRWTDFQTMLPAPLQGPGSRFHLSRLKSGAVLLINHLSRARRERLAAWLSDDDGKTWSEPWMIDERNEVAYPDACQDAEGRIHMIYEYDRRGDSEILYFTMTEEEIRQGQKGPIVVSRKKKEG